MQNQGISVESLMRCLSNIYFESILLHASPFRIPIFVSCYAVGSSYRNSLLEIICLKRNYSLFENNHIRITLKNSVSLIWFKTHISVHTFLKIRTYFQDYLKQCFSTWMQIQITWVRLLKCRNKFRALAWVWRFGMSNKQPGIADLRSIFWAIRIFKLFLNSVILVCSDLINFSIAAIHILHVCNRRFFYSIS